MVSDSSIVEKPVTHNINHPNTSSEHQPLPQDTASDKHHHPFSTPITEPPNPPTPIRPEGTIKQPQPSTRSVYAPRPFEHARTKTPKPRTDPDSSEPPSTPPFHITSGHTNVAKSKHDNITSSNHLLLASKHQSAIN
ncbi:hypothetical protein QL285_014581 [Trifolium repens]|nr:hypothetical protein QL285_014581 [Trifolium repens]